MALYAFGSRQHLTHYYCLILLLLCSPSQSLETSLDALEATLRTASRYAIDRS